MGFYLSNGNCFLCDQSCESCFGAGYFSCLKCKSDYIWNPILYECQKQCPQGFAKTFCSPQIFNEYCCIEICGDGIKILQSCDDGNTVDGDGCSGICNTEFNFFCSYNQKMKADICKYIPPLIMNLNLPEGSATLVSINFNYPLLMYNESFIKFILLSLSIDTNYYDCQISFRDSTTIEITLNYTISFKSANLIIEVTNPSYFRNSYNQSLTLTHLSIKLPSYDYLPPEAQHLINVTSQASDSGRTFVSLLIASTIVIFSNPVLLYALLSTMQLLFYLSLIRINYPTNFNAIIGGSSVFAFEFFPNYILDFAKSQNYIPQIKNIFTDNNIYISFVISNGSLICYILLISICHLIVRGLSRLLNRPLIIIMKAGKYREILLMNKSYINLTAFLIIFNLNYQNWFQIISNLLSYIAIIYFAIWMILQSLEMQTQLEILDNAQDEINSNNLIFTEYKVKVQFFGIIDCLKDTLFSLSLIIFEYYPLLNVAILLTTNLIYIYLLIKLKPSHDNKICIFTESGNALLLGIISVWAFDDKFNWLNEYQRIKIGWGVFALVILIVMINALVSIFKFILVLKNKIKIRRSRLLTSIVGIN